MSFLTKCLTNGRYQCLICCQKENANIVFSKTYKIDFYINQKFTENTPEKMSAFDEEIENLQFVLNADYENEYLLHTTCFL